ncbi:MAG: Imm1 family immunity protein [Acidobacteriota bacterium]
MPILEWSAIQPRVELSTPEEFDHAIDTLSTRAAKHPSIVAFYAHGHQVMLGLGLPQSFVQIQEAGDPESKPALLTVGDAAADGAVAFFLLGSQQTEVPRRNLIPAASAQRVARQFLTSGKVPEDVTWERA